MSSERELLSRVSLWVTRRSQGAERSQPPLTTLGLSPGTTSSGAAPKGRKASLHHSYTLPLMSKRLPPLELRVPSQLWGVPLEFAAYHATDAGSSLPAYLYFCCLRPTRAALPPPRHLRPRLLAGHTHRLRL